MARQQVLRTSIRSQKLYLSEIMLKIYISVDKPKRDGKHNFVMNKTRHRFIRELKNTGG